VKSIWFADSLGICRSVVSDPGAGPANVDGGGVYNWANTDFSLEEDPTTTFLDPLSKLRTTLAWTPSRRLLAQEPQDILVGFEVEFYFNHPRRPQSPDTYSRRGEMHRLRMVRLLEQAGVAVWKCHHEAGTGQHEIALPPLPPLLAADALFKTRSVVLDLAERLGLRVSFLPHLGGSESRSSGLHMHLSGSADDDAWAHSLSRTSRELQLLAGPTPECVARLCTRRSTPGSATVGTTREDLVRRLSGRFEFRLPSPVADPYVLTTGISRTRCLQPPILSRSGLALDYAAVLRNFHAGRFSALLSPATLEFFERNDFSVYRREYERGP
jgi:hypothetical protein